MEKETRSESESVTPPTVVTGLGYPNGREENSPEPTGWQPAEGEISSIKESVSRETI